MRLVSALVAISSYAVQGMSKKTSNEVLIYSLETSSGADVPLLDVLQDLPRYFELARDDVDPADFPQSFAFPKSFQYELTFGKVTRSSKRDSSIFVGDQKAIFDDESNRVRIERTNKVFQEWDTEVRVYDFNQMRLLVSDPIKDMCLKKKIQDISPVSMVPRENDQIVISDSIQQLWVPPRQSSTSNDWHIDDISSDHQEAKTRYLGEHSVTLRSTGKELLDSELFHIFVNNYSFLDLETKYGQRGGADGATTLYLFRELTQ